LLTGTGMYCTCRIDDDDDEEDDDQWWWWWSYQDYDTVISPFHKEQGTGTEFFKFNHMKK
jgi:hypothetical protein